MAEQLAAPVTNATITVGVGNFLYQDTDQLAPFSSLIQKKLEAALTNTGKIQVVFRSRIAELQNQGEFRGTAPFDPDRPVKPLKIDEVKAMVRGRFFAKESEVTIHAEMVMLETGKALSTVKASLLRREMPAAFGSAQTDMTPFNFHVGRTNIQDVESRLANVPHDFQVEVVIKEGKRDFVQGESISYRIWSPVACHVAVFDHQVDGSTVLLFPNAYQTNTWVQSPTCTDIPGYNRDGFFLRIGKPFGADVIQIIACTEENILHRKMAELAQNTPTLLALAKVPRELVVAVVRHLDDGIATPGAALKPKWSESHFVLSTRPKTEL